MAAIRSLGLHTPSALPYLISESILPPDPSPDLYKWETYTDGGAEEEILTTHNCVVWSRGRIVRKLFSFAIEKEKVTHAVLTWFPAHEDVLSQGISEQHPVEGAVHVRKKPPVTPDVGSASLKDAARALVVFLKSQAHVFFLSGASHVVTLPFEVDRAFPVSRGLILQRKLSSTALSTLSQATPLIPGPPNNSFIFPPSQHLFPPSVSFSPTANSKRQTTASFLGLDFDLLQSQVTPSDHNLPRHFSFTSPLSQLGLLVRSAPVATEFLRPNVEPSKALDALQTEEEILYTTATDELPSEDNSGIPPLAVMVTCNQEKGLYSIWHASYLNSRPVSKLLSGKSTPTVGTKSRRRSSFLTATGASTPVARPRDGFRESFGGPSRGKTVPTSAGLSSSQRRESGVLQAPEEVLASRVDPEFELRQPARESRRVSSIQSRAELNASFDRSGFKDLTGHHSGVSSSFPTHGRRGHSLGGAYERRSFGAGSQRRLRASTPGTFSRLSIDDMSETGTVLNLGINGSQASTTFDDMDGYADLTNSYEGPESLDPQNPLDGYKKEVFMVKFAEISINDTTKTYQGSSQQSKEGNPKVFAIASPKNCDESGYHGRRYFLLISNPATLECIQIEFSVRLRKPPNDGLMEDSQDLSTQKSRLIPVPSVRSKIRKGGVIDILKISDGTQSRMVYLRGDQAGQPYVSLFAPWSAESDLKIPLSRLRIFNPFDVATDSSSSPRVVGVKRRLTVPESLKRLENPGPNATLDIVSSDGHHHQIQVQLQPRDEIVSRIIELCNFILPFSVGDRLQMIWWNRCHAYGKLLYKEWHALAVSLLSLVLSLEDDRKSRRSHRRQTALTSSSLRTTLDDPSTLVTKLESSWGGQNAQNVSSWSWVLDSSNHSHRSPKVAQLTASPGRRREKRAKHPHVYDDYFALGHIAVAREFIKSPEGNALIGPLRSQFHTLARMLPKLLVSLHLVREELKLTSVSQSSSDAKMLALVIAQFGRWFGWSEWDWKRGNYYHLELLSTAPTLEDAMIFADPLPPIMSFESPPSIMHWLEMVSTLRPGRLFPSTDSLLPSGSGQEARQSLDSFTPRTGALMQLFSSPEDLNIRPDLQVEAMIACGINTRMLETLPEALLAMLKEPIVHCQAHPPTTWSSSLLTYVARDDLNLLITQERLNWPELGSDRGISHEGVRDLHSISQSAEHPEQIHSFPNSDRMVISRLIFNQDRRFSEAVHMIEPYRIAVAQCIPGPDWTEAQVLDAQREVHHWVMTRTFALAPGLAFAHFDSRMPLLSEKFNIHGYNTLCVMKPMNNTVSVDRSTFTEERYAWAWFHSGVAAGLSISKHAEGIDTSWIVFNRPPELNNRHAGLLLALGLNGHLRAMAKWLAFKYLTPKHTMTSIGLLLGLSASRIGTMDTLVTRLLSVHVTRMLPPGAAELNLSTLTQTAGLMGIGLLYHNTQHRRMSEVMLSEIENLEAEDLSAASEPVRDESYRLAAGFALGLINLGQGADLKGLHDLRLVERLLAIAVGARPVNLVHLIDQATAGATIALGLIFMKTANRALARKIDVPDTVAQFDFVRPDVLLLRTLAKHLILWDNIRPTYQWIIRNLPKAYAKDYHLRDIKTLSTEHMPFFNILAGLLWSISLRFSGSGDTAIRDFLVKYLDQFIRLCRLPALRYDSKLARNTVRNCQDLVALAAATVMAGTGDLELFRRFRSLHGRVNADTPYGSHMAGHMALGALFFGAGCYTFGTTNLAVAALIAAFYPVFPMDVTDNKAHLQAFRHFWALAAEPRCIIPRDIDSHRVIGLDLTLQLRDGTTRRITAPRLLPDIDTIARITTASSEYWPVTLDFANNPAHLVAFRRNQSLHVRRRPAHEAHTSVFTATLLALNEVRTGKTKGAWIFRLPAFKQFEMADLNLFTDSDERTSALLELRGSAVDERLLLNSTATSGWDRDRLWNLRILLEWADRMALEGDVQLKWIPREVLEKWKSIIQQRASSRPQAE